MISNNYKHSNLTNSIIKCYYSVYNILGYGFLEKVYEKSLLIELENISLNCIAQHPVDVYYSQEKVGMYFADILVENVVIIEIKAAEAICEEHEAQLTNYLKATSIEVGLLLNFGKKPEFKRKVFSSEYKKIITHHNQS